MSCTEQLLASVRRHWQVENSVFFLKDRWWDEDRHWTRRAGLSEWLGADHPRHDDAALFCSPSEPLRPHADYIAWRTQLGLEILGLE